MCTTLLGLAAAAAPLLAPWPGSPGLVSPGIGLPGLGLPGPASRGLALQEEGEAGAPATLQDPAVEIDPESEPSPVATAPSEGFQTPAGFEVELVYSVPADEQGSWVSICFDPAGRAICGDQFGGIWRVDPRTAPPAAERLPVDLVGAQGLLWFADALYVVVNGGAESGLWRATDSDGDDRVDVAELLVRLEGEGEHGPHAVVPHPDGRSLVLACGNHTALPRDLERSRPAPVWEEDQLLPRLSDPNGHAVGIGAPGGYVLRTDTDGGSRELWAIGLRNAYDLAFDRDGELFTFDSDMEWDAGLSWYRPARILHVASGADFGWRHGSGKWPEWVPDSMPAVLDVGLASPTGVLFPYGARFPERWRDALLACDWAYGTIWAVHVDPAGAGYAATVEPFVRGRPMPVTDLAVGPDGAVWFTTGGRDTQSGLYRVRYTGDTEGLAESAPVTRRPLAPALEQRRALEALHGVAPDAAAGDPDETLSLIWAGLGSADPLVRRAARTALEHAPVERWRLRALEEPALVPATGALLALARVDPGSARDALGRLLALEAESPIDAATDELVLEFLRALEIACIRGGAPPEGQAAEIARRLLALFPSRDPRRERVLADLLVYLDAGPAAGLLVERLESAPREDALHLAFSLRALESGWTPALRERYARWLGAAGGWSGGASFAPYLAALRDEVRARWSTEERERLEPLLATPATSRHASTRRFVRSWTVPDLEGSLPAAGYGRSFERGEELYREAGCADCHPMQGAGGVRGPELSGAGARFAARDLLVAVLEPSATISDQYADVQLRTRDGGVHVGRIVERAFGSIAIETGDDPPDRILVLEDELELMRAHPVSRMPAGLLDALDQGEILDLVAYVLAGADPSDPAFRE